MSEKSVRMTMLFDFFGDLLTDRQREYFDLYFNEDYSLSEIAEQTGVSRQGIHANLTRAVRILEQTEEKTGLLARFGETSLLHAQVAALAEHIAATCEGPGRADALEILRLLEQWKG